MKLMPLLSSSTASTVGFTIIGVVAVVAVLLIFYFAAKRNSADRSINFDDDLDEDWQDTSPIPPRYDPVNHPVKSREQHRRSRVNPDQFRGEFGDSDSGIDLVTGVVVASALLSDSEEEPEPPEDVYEQEPETPKADGHVDAGYGGSTTRNQPASTGYDSGSYDSSYDSSSGGDSGGGGCD